MAQREKRLTKREKKELNPQRPAHAHDHQHIHCVACGKHLDPESFEATPPGSIFIRCQHGSDFPACAGCEVEAKFRIDEHDRTGKPVSTARAWH